MHQAIFFLKSLIIYATGGIAFLLLIPKDPKNAIFFGYSASRLLMILGLATIILATLLCLSRLKKSKNFQLRVQRVFDGSMTGSPLIVYLYLVFLIIMFLSMLFFTWWIFFSTDRFGAIFLRLSPLATFATLFSAHGMFALRANIANLLSRIRLASKTVQVYTKKYRILWLMILLLAVYIGNSYYDLSIMHAEQINDTLPASDQESYLSIAQKAYQTNFRYMGDRNHTPLYPYLLTIVYEPGLDIDEFFKLGKNFNVVISMTLLVALYFLMLKFLSASQSAILTTISATSLYVYKAGYVQPELLYYSLSFLGFMLMGWMLIRPSIPLGILIGAVIAIAYYAKAAILPGFGLFLATYFVQILINCYQGKRDGAQLEAPEDFLRKKILPVLLAIVVFVGLLLPYLLDNKRIFGTFFYNVNSTFYLWYDSWNDVELGTKAHGDDVGWPEMPPEQIPSLKKYLHEHTTYQILERFKLGFESQLDNILNTYSEYNFLIIYTFSLVVFGLIYPRVSIRLILDYKFVFLFGLGYFIGYLILYAWFAPITNFHDARFTYSLYLPYLFSVFATLNMIVSRVNGLRIGPITIQTRYLLWGLHVAVLFLALINFIEITPMRLAKLYYGK